MGKLEILKKLEARRRRCTEIQKSMVSHIQYQGDLRRGLDRANMRADRSRLQGVLSRNVAGTSQLARDRYEELTKHLGL